MEQSSMRGSCPNREENYSVSYVGRAAEVEVEAIDDVRVVNDAVDGEDASKEPEDEMEMVVETGEISKEVQSSLGKMKPIEKVSQWKQMTKEQNFDRLITFNSSLCLVGGGKETEVMRSIVEDFHSSKKSKELGPSNEELGKGKRTPIPKKKF